MSKNLDVRFGGEDESLPYRALDVRVSSSRSVVTPVRAIDARLARRAGPRQVHGARLFECYSKYGASTVDSRMRETGKQQDHTYDVNGLRAIAAGQPLVAFEEFFETAYPSEQQLQYIIRTSHAMSDIVTIPLVSRITDKLSPQAGFEKYEAFVKRSLETIDTYNRKPVMGVVPLRLPFVHIEPLVKLYHDHDVRALCLDFAGATPSTAKFQLEQALYSLSRLGVLKQTYLHALNVSPGRPKARALVSPCKSILSFGYSLDSYGDLHRTRVVMPGAPPRPTPSRLFSRKDYGDHLVKVSKDAKRLTPEDTGLDPAACVDNRMLTKLFNSEQHALEAASLPSLFRQAQGKLSLESYLASKQYVEKGVVKTMRELGTRLRSSKTKKSRQTKILKD